MWWVCGGMGWEMSACWFIGEGSELMSLVRGILTPWQPVPSPGVGMLFSQSWWPCGVFPISLGPLGSSGLGWRWPALGCQMAMGAPPTPGWGSGGCWCALETSPGHAPSQFMMQLCHALIQSLMGEYTGSQDTLSPINLFGYSPQVFIGGPERHMDKWVGQGYLFGHILRGGWGCLLVYLSFSLLLIAAELWSSHPSRKILYLVIWVTSQPRCSLLISAKYSRLLSVLSPTQFEQLVCRVNGFTCSPSMANPPYWRNINSSFLKYRMWIAVNQSWN